MLFIVRDGEPILQQGDATASQHFFKFWNASKEFFVFIIGTKPHDPFYTCSVVPTAVKENDFTSSGQMGHVALEVPLRSFAVVGSRQGSDPTNARVESLGNAFDHTAFSRGIATFKQDHHFLLSGHHPILQLD